MVVVNVYADGACKGNGGVNSFGGWGVVLQCGQHSKELSGFERNTTNNRMELMSCIQGLMSLKTGYNPVVNIYTDSKYVRDGITGWIIKWKVNGWITSSKDPVKNKDLWIMLDTFCKMYQVNWHWVKGHADNPGNLKADELAQSAAARLKDESTSV